MLAVTGNACGVTTEVTQNHFCCLLLEESPHSREREVHSTFWWEMGQRTCRHVLNPTSLKRNVDRNFLAARRGVTLYDIQETSLKFFLSSLSQGTMIPHCMAALSSSTFSVSLPPFSIHLYCLLSILAHAISTPFFIVKFRLSRFPFPHGPSLPISSMEPAISLSF